MMKFFLFLALGLAGVVVAMVAKNGIPFAASLGFEKKAAPTIEGESVPVVVKSDEPKIRANRRKIEPLDISGVASVGGRWMLWSVDGERLEVGDWLGDLEIEAMNARGARVRDELGVVRIVRFRFQKAVPLLANGVPILALDRE